MEKPITSRSSVSIHSRRVSSSSRSCASARAPPPQSLSALCGCFLSLKDLACGGVGEMLFYRVRWALPRAVVRRLHCCLLSTADAPTHPMASTADVSTADRNGLLSVQPHGPFHFCLPSPPPTIMASSMVVPSITAASYMRSGPPVRLPPSGLPLPVGAVALQFGHPSHGSATTFQPSLRGSRGAEK